ncbi:putative salicylate hydroxylase [Aspergillus clavatus NRRL 1]|uniref:Salicylate hydroxylase, putative n=1 Tax=Aspergillus clavatus (strain ATCC 1007 / CBS 513.65 / DSM 816 / NCTC 3887 / NRRL 1 / QM 1276 / 107) TaxID=344612 RepID=A1CCS4_ASPCL|nr:salicylate hydroxylase, putative [Aspergillus clavatus NRRL 1]EAW12331.1 salicylate hydroxylase, putative [Aspergillus clavatus NRRL 1]
MGATEKQFTVAIVGGGIGGLTLAAGLLRRNVPVQIYEAAAEFKEVGLGLTIGPAAHRAMPLLDPQIREIYDSLITTHADSPGYERFRQTWFEVVWATGLKAGEVLMDLQALPSGQTTVRRADFLDALVSLIPDGVAHFGKRLVELVETAAGVELRFGDGSVATADVVVGCDGIHSKVKEFMLPEEHEMVRPRYSGMYGYRAVLDMETMVEAVGDHRARVATMYVGDGAYGISYPIMRAKKVNVGLYVLRDQWDDEAWVRPASKEDMRRDLAHMGEYVNRLVEHMPDPSQWAIFEHPHSSTYARSRVVILGDAAHASTPHQGAGAGQAIEDSHVLAELLGDASVVQAEDAVAALQAYDAVRRPRSQRVVATSKENAFLLCLRLTGVGGDEERLKATFQERLRWLWDIDVQDQAERARSIMLEEMQRR